MTGMLLTKNSGFIIGPISSLIGFIMNGIFTVLDKIGIPNIGLAIIILTLVVYLCMMPLTYKQQKFSKLSAKMNPELQAVQAKYKGKKDQDSMMKMNEETKAIYEKYGVSPSGSCLQLVIQLPIMWALYRVIYNVPAYVPSVKKVFVDLVDKLVTLDGSTEFIQGFGNAAMYNKQFTSDSFVAGSEFMKNTFIDVLNKASSTEWMSLKDNFSSVATEVQKTYDALSHFNNFLGLNIGNSPSYIIMSAFQSKAYLMIIGALMIPLLAALTQFLNVQLMPQPENNGKSGNDQADAMAASMKSMNMMMPIMSAVFCFTLPTGLGLYWIAGAVVRSIQQVAINRYIDRIDFDEVIKQNIEKAEEKRKKQKDYIAAATVNNSARKNTKNITSSTGLSESEREALVEKAKNASKNKGSIAAKANMVRDYNEKNSK